MPIKVILSIKYIKLVLLALKIINFMQARTEIEWKRLENNKINFIKVEKVFYELNVFKIAVKLRLSIPDLKLKRRSSKITE
jgi:hypothetical protein